MASELHQAVLQRVLPGNPAQMLAAPGTARKAPLPGAPAREVRAPERPALCASAHPPGPLVAMSEGPGAAAEAEADMALVLHGTQLVLGAMTSARIHPSVRRSVCAVSVVL